jgi:hypothetical protein
MGSHSSLQPRVHRFAFALAYKSNFREVDGIKTTLPPALTFFKFFRELDVRIAVQ